MVPSAALAVLLGLLPAVPVAAQSAAPAPQTSCSLTTVAEVNAAFQGAGLALGDNSSGYYCTFRGRLDLVIQVALERTLAQTREDFGEGIDLRVAGRPAWFQESSGNMAVELDRAVLFMNGYDPDAAVVDSVPLSALAALIVPRIPAMPDQATVDALKALLPAGPDGAPMDTAMIPGWYLAGQAPASPPIQAVLDVLGASGAAASDLVLVYAGSDTHVVLLARAAGVDPGALTMPLAYLLGPSVEGADVSEVEVAGRSVARIASDPPVHVTTTPDTAVLLSGSEAFVAAVVGALP